MSIIGSLPYNLTNGQVADATQVMADFNTVVNAVNNSTTGAASIPNVQASTYNYAADTGTVNAIIVGVAVSPSVYTDGLQGNFKAANTNTSQTVTIKYGSLGTKALVIDQAGSLPIIGSIILGMHYRTEYDSTQDKVILINPSPATGTQTLTATGGTAAPTLTMTWRMTADACFANMTFGAGTVMISNATTFTYTGLPVWLEPAITQSFYATAVDNSAATVASMTLTAGSTVITMNKGAAIGSGASGWTASGTKTFNASATSGTNYSITFAVK